MVRQVRTIAATYTDVLRVIKFFYPLCYPFSDGLNHPEPCYFHPTLYVYATADRTYTRRTASGNVSARAIASILGSSRWLRVCTRYPRVQHTKRQLGEEQEGGRGGWLGRRGAERAAAAVEREKNREGKRGGGIETSSSAARVPLRDRGRRALFSCIRGTMGRRSRHRSLLNFLLGAASRGAAQSGATRDDYRPSGAARRDGRTEPSGMRECRQKSTERDGNGDRTRATEIEREIGTVGDAVKSGREREKERGEKEERRLCRPGRRRASRRALISTGFRRTTDGQRWSLVAYEVGRTSLEVFRGRTRCAHHGRIESEREKVAAVERDGRSRTSRA